PDRGRGSGSCRSSERGKGDLRVAGARARGRPRLPPRQGTPITGATALGFCKAVRARIARVLYCVSPKACAFAATVSVLLLGASAVPAAPWCAAYRNGSNNCGFYTYEQCLAAVSGVGGFCNRNYEEPERPAVRRERKSGPKSEPKSESKPKRQERAAPAPSPPAATVQPQPAPPAAAPPPAAAQPPASTAQQQASFGAARALILSGKYEAGIAAMKALGYDDHPDVAGSI